ncbi:hypothetical protein [Pelagicoccus sp. SDUM812003]|uniref:hypothetical protein n=1 Tax=Pelagicoccus sp. SDUM812003 TaxID=3041267 RepID=UPI00280CF03A|nr:hypothetical protein [Pelagicoccus sp. SDUM812003]MDQ8205696.1 hypothetical protein [Pelagicoccus sp. SDUM812003]
MKAFISLILFLAMTSFAQAELTIISTEHRDADSFKRLSEYLTGKRSDGRYSVLRTLPESRDGFYISLKSESKETPASTDKVVLSFVRPGTQEIETRVFEQAKLSKKRILVGLTGEQWSQADSWPVAWKVEFFDADETLLDSVTSFLWSE